MVYDAIGRKTSQTDTSPTLSAKTVSYQYDAAGNRTRLTWPDGYYAAYGYDAVNHPTTVIDSSGTTLATYGYDNLARRAALQFSGTTGARMLTSWSAENDLLTLSNDLAGTANDAGYTHTFTPAHQWATSSISNAAFKYTPPTGTATAYGGANAVNQVPIIGGTAMAYDTRGNLTTDGTTGTTYLYDAENRMMSATRSGATSTYAYDPLGRRTSKTVSASTTNFVYDGDNGIADYGGGTLARRFVPGPDIDNYIATVSSSGAIKFYHTDKMGSIVAMSDVNGNLAEGPYVYDAYGNCFSSGAACSAGVGFRYTGQRLDPETGLYYYRARYYQPGIGQFLQTDPVGYKDNLDLYGYVGDDPTDRTDPTGDQAIVCLPDGCVPVAAPPPVTGGGAPASGHHGLGDYIVHTWKNSHPDDSSPPPPPPPDLANPPPPFVPPADAVPNPTSESPSGHYENLHESGRTYAGKGNKQRSQVSGKRIEKQTGDKHIATDWQPAPTDRDAFKGEAGRIREAGGIGNSDIYNKINSPGEKYLNEDANSIQ
jgi:RHS repeat-associated protein